MSEPRCADCRYFDGSTLPDSGECRRYPPSAESGWPNVRSCDSCGEFAISAEAWARMPKKPLPPRQPDIQTSNDGPILFGMACMLVVAFGFAFAATYFK